jgi:phage shock protein A
MEETEILLKQAIREMEEDLGRDEQRGNCGHPLQRR